jgi:hypothetical protein
MYRCTSSRQVTRSCPEVHVTGCNVCLGSSYSASPSSFPVHHHVATTTLRTLAVLQLRCVLLCWSNLSTHGPCWTLSIRARSSSFISSSHILVMPQRDFVLLGFFPALFCLSLSLFHLFAMASTGLLPACMRRMHAGLPRRDVLPRAWRACAHMCFECVFPATAHPTLITLPLVQPRINRA